MQRSFQIVILLVFTGRFSLDAQVRFEFLAGVNRNILFRNLGNGRFEDVTRKAGLAGKVRSISAGWFDYDNDARLNLFVSNYVAWDPRTEPRCGPPDAPIYCHPDSYHGLSNQLFHNNGDGTFTDVSQKSGVARHAGKGMGIAFADFDRDGFIDVFVATDSVASFLFRNQADGTFREMGVEAGVTLREDGATIAGMGADFRDFDNDGLPDLVVSGRINDTFLLFPNLGKRRLFEDFGGRSGLLMGTRQFTGWSLGMYDFDNDGRVDAVVSVLNGPAKLYRNISAAGNWAAFRLRGRQSNRQGLGSEIRLTLADGRVLPNHATTSVCYASSSEPLVRFGLGASTEIKRVEVRWPGGRIQSLAGVATGRVVDIEEAGAK